MVLLPQEAAALSYANYYFTKVTDEAGLSQINVKTILQDSYGFMWFGTRNRLNRYDGTNIKVFDCYDPSLQQGNNNISSLFEDKDKKLWVGTDKGIFIYDPIFEAFSFFNDSTAENIRIVDWVADIREDMNRNIWIVIPNQGLFRYHIPDKKLTHYAIGSSNVPDHGNPQCICIEQNGTVWIGTNGGGVYRYNRTADTFTQYLGNNGNNDSLKNENIYTLCDYGDELVVGIHEGRLRKLNKKRNTLSDVNAPDVHYKIIRHVVCYDGEIWVGTHSGLFIINELKNKVVHLQQDRIVPYALSDNVVEKIYRDRENGIWIGTMFGGANYLPQRSFNFECYVPMSSSEHSISGRRVRELKEDKQGNIWIATEDAGLSIFNPVSKEFKNYSRKEGMSFNSNYIVLGMLLQNDKAWIGLFKNGMDIIRLPQFNIRHYTGADLNMDEASVYAICEDRYGQVWLGNGWNVYRSKAGTMNFERMDIFGLNFVYDIMEDSNGFIWVATLGNGVFKYDPAAGAVKHYTHNPADAASISSASVSSITETSTGDIWFATDRGGICRYNSETDNFTSFSIKDGFPDDVAYKIIEDKNRMLWFGTNNGLVRFNPATKEVKVLSHNNGLPFKEFNYKSALLSSAGQVYFGGLEGLITFDPYSFKENSFIPPVYITRLIAQEASEKSIIHSNKIVLKHDQSNVGFEFVALSYTAPQANQYAYKMEGIDKDWIHTNNTYSASYAKLPPGKYTFRVKGSNNDGLWNETGTSVEIEILPPWWLSNIALIAYLVIAVFLIYYSLSRYMRKMEEKHTEKRKLFEAEKEKELYDSKIEFFTNIAHEIRTPVTLINGPLELMSEMDIQDAEITKSLAIMRRNTDELLDLVNKLLDIRKVDSNKFPLYLSSNNISEMLRSIYEQFELVASQQGKSGVVSLPDDEVHTQVDKDVFTRIINNLLSNALRYSEKHIELELTQTQDTAYIKVRNDGELVPEEARDKIFDPFYQVEKRRNSSSGSGIGLYLARSLAGLHGGLLYFSEERGMNVFILQIPMKQGTIEAEEEKIPENDFICPEDEDTNDKLKAEVILVVEDNVEMLSFITGELRKHFVIERALNGTEALKVMEEKNIALILTDVMMPGMDGFELCQSIKNNLNYSHVPIVLLTAKNDLNSKIHGLEMGADAYIEKPFAMSHLIAQLTTLLNNRRREKEAFIRRPFLPVQQLGMNKADEQFMQKVIDIIQDNISDSSFNVERLSESVFMSRSNLHRKIKALTELAPTEFIHLIRLKKAAELIQSGSYRIGEIGYLVGIHSTSYFIKLFRKQFGLTPKEFAKQQQEGRGEAVL